MNLCPDYSKFTLSKLRTKEFSHVALLFYWVIYGLFFLYFERIRTCTYNTVECSLDAYIPFVPLFIVPYFFWFVYLIGMLLYTFFCDVAAFKKYMWYIILTYSVTIVVYFVYPTKQELRPVIEEGASGLARIVSGLYVFDTNTNVCPSIHVLGSLAVFFTSRECKPFKKPWIKLVFFVLAVLISVSTVFLKQHSAVDILAAVVVALGCYPMVFCDNKVSEKLLGVF